MVMSCHKLLLTYGATAALRPGTVLNADHTHISDDAK